MNRTIDSLIDAILADASETSSLALETLGFRRPDAAHRNLRSILAGRTPREFGEFVEALAPLLPENPDPDRALDNLERFEQVAFGSLRPSALATENPPLFGLLVGLLGFSQFMTDALIRYPHLAAWLGDPDTLEARPTADEIRESLRAEMRAVEAAPLRLDAAIRWLRQNLVRLGAQIVAGRIDEIEMMRRLSEQASALVQAAIDEARRELDPRFGRPMSEDDPSRESLFCVVGMGKLGAGELNFSSDIDLIYLYSEEGTTTGVPRPGASSGSAGPGGAAGEAPDPAFHVGRISNHEYFRRLSELVTRFLQDRSNEGYLYIVDLRLRPEGADGPLARSLASFEIYHETQARLWERMALVKARAIAGDDALREEFDRLAPALVFQRALDSDVIRRVRELKRQIDSDVERGGTAGREIKRGEGGIREIEFLVQTMQLLHGPSDHHLRARATLDAIEAFERRGRWSPERAARVRDDYLFLRVLEHRLQMLNLKQTHTLPSDPDEIDSLARRCGVPPDPPAESDETPEAAPPTAGERLLARHREIRERVHADFVKFFGKFAPEEPAPELSLPPAERAARAILSGAPEREKTPPLATFGLDSPEALGVLDRIAGHGRSLYLTERARELLGRVMPRLIEAAGSSARPVAGLARLESFLQASASFTSLYEVFAANPNVMRLFVHLFALSAESAATLAAHPEFTDYLLDPSILAEAPDAGAIERRVARVRMREIDAGADPDAAFSAALAFERRFRTLVTVTAECAGIADAALSTARLSYVAEAMLGLAVRQAAEARGIRGADAVGAGGGPAGFCVLTMGKLGTLELNTRSDLDLVFVRDDRGVGAASRVPLSESEAHALGERVVRSLERATPEGAPFAIDARLRPEGAGAPLVPNLSRYLEYYGDRARLWEFQSLMKLRPVAGDLETGRALVAGALAVARRRLRAMDWSRDVLGELRTMRRRMDQSAKTPGWALCDFKKGRGGVTDLEFLAQEAQLRALRDSPDGENAPDSWTLPPLHGLRPDQVFAAERDAGRLAPEEAGRRIEDYRFLRKLEARSRILFETEKSLLPSGGEKLEALARAMASCGESSTADGAGASSGPAASPEAFRDQVLETMRRVRGSFDRGTEARA